MTFQPTLLPGAWLIGLESHVDERGMFSRSFCAREFSERGLVSIYVQANLCTNRRRGTVRGMHFQRAPHEEVKLVRCIHGAIHDIIVDVRPGSRTYLQSFAVELSAEAVVTTAPLDAPPAEKDTAADIPAMLRTADVAPAEAARLRPVAPTTVTFEAMARWWPIFV